MQRAETLTHQLPVGFSANELAVAARWIATRSRSVASLAQIENALAAVQSILIRAHGVVCLRGFSSDFGLEVLCIPPASRVGGELINQGEVDPIALADIGRALRAEFLASHRDMVPLKTDDGAQVIVYAIEKRAIVLAATCIQLVKDE